MSQPNITETKSGVVYLLTSPSGKRYVGQTWDFQQRKRDYKNKQAYGQSALHHAIVKYGWDNFAVDVLASGIQDQSTLDKVESAFIALLNTLSPHGYNLTTGGKGGKLSEETRKKMSASHKGKKMPLDAVEKSAAAHRGKPLSSEHRAKLSDALKGKTLSQKHRDKIGASKIGVKRKPFSKEWRENMSVAQKGRKQSAETRAKIGAANRGRKHSPEACAKMKIAWLNRKQSDCRNQISFL